MGKKFEPKNKTETVKQMNPTYSGGFVGFIVVVFNGEIVVVKFDDKKFAKVLDPLFWDRS